MIAKDVAARLTKLRQAYIKTIPQKVQVLSDQLQQCLQSQWDEESVSTLTRTIHNLNGSGATFGLENISNAADKIEKALKEITLGERSQEIFATVEVRTLKFIELLSQVPLSECKANDTASAKKAQKPTIFVVEDEPSQLQAIVDCFAPERYQVYEFCSTNGLADALIKYTPEIIILDLILPEGPTQSSELVAKYLQLGHSPRVIVQSITSDFRARLLAAKLDAEYFFTKPLDFERITKTVEAWCYPDQAIPYRVLIVDDDSSLAEYYASALALHGCDTKVLNNPSQIIDACEEFDPELVLMDVNMPECSGIEAARILRQFDRYSSLSIVFLSTETNFERQLTALNCGGDEFLTKPIPVDVLVKALLARLKRVRRTLEIFAKLKQAEIAARSIAEEKAIFLANMSHEIRTPMNGVLGMAEMLADTNLGPNQVEYLGIIQDSGKTMIALLNDILDVSKLESGKVYLESKPINIPRFLGRTAAIFWPMCQKKGIHLSVNIESTLISEWRGDEIRIGQIVTNLVNNAVKFTENGSIKINAFSNQNALVFEIEDTGIGIESSKIAEIFKPFTQSDVSTTRKYGGTGLGLTICNSLTDIMGGNLHFQSSIGIGTRATLTLPIPNIDKSKTYSEVLKSFHTQKVAVVGANKILECSLVEEVKSCGVDLTLLDRAPDDTYDIYFCDDPLIVENLPKLSTLFYIGDTAQVGRTVYQTDYNAPLITILEIFSPRANPPPVQTYKASASGAGKKVLLVEDNPTNQKVASVMLTKLGIEVTIVENGKEAVEAVGESPFDLVLMDCQMPIMDGYDASRRIKEAMDKPPPIIALTAYVSAEEQSKCLSFGMDDYLSKPLNRNALAEKLKDFGVLSKIH